MRANSEITMTERVEGMQQFSMFDALDSAAIRAAEFVLRLLSGYLVYGFGLPRENFEIVKEN